MAVTITSQQYIDGIAPGTFSGFSLFNIAEWMLVVTDVEFFTQVAFPPASPLLTGNAANQNHLYRSGGFANVSVGDIIRIVDTAPGNFFNTSNNQKVTVLVKYNNNEVLVSNPIAAPFTDLPISESYNTTIVMYNLTEIKSMDYAYNFIENSAPNNYQSFTTNQQQTYKASNIDTSTLLTPSILIPQGGIEWQSTFFSFISNSNVWRVSYDANNGRQVFRITHNVMATPWFVPSQLSDASNNIAPPYYLSGNCLKYICRISGLRSLNDPNSLQVTESNPNILGNSGWFDESFNGGAQNYFIQNVAYSDTNGSIPNLNPYLTSGQTIQFEIYSPSGDFVSGQKLAIGAMKLPNNANEFQNNGRSLSDNFLFCNIYGSVNGLFYNHPNSGVNNFIDKWSATVSNPNTIKVTVKLVFNTATQAIIAESATPRFTFFATLANPALTSVLTQNKQVIWDGVKDFNISVQPADTGIVQTFKRHYENASSAGITGLVTTFKNDECVMVSNIYGTWMETPTTQDEINLTNIGCSLVAKRVSDGVEFLLEDFQLPTTVIYQGGAPVFNYTNNRVFQIPTTEIRKPITIQVVNYGIGNNQFVISYPFMIRWETWVQLIGANSDFYDTLQPNNGLNEDWEHYLTANWEIYFRTSYDVYSSISPYHFEKDLLIPINDYATNPDYITKKVEAFTTGGTLLQSTGVNYIQSAQNTVIKATFEKTGGLLVANCRVVFGIEIRQQGGIGGRVRYSSVWETNNPLTWFVPFSGSINKVLISQITPDKVEAKATLDHTLLPQGNITYTIVARLYEVPEPINPELFKKMSDGTYKLMSSGVQKIMA